MHARRRAFHLYFGKMLTKEAYAFMKVKWSLLALAVAMASPVVASDDADIWGAQERTLKPEAVHQEEAATPGEEEAVEGQGTGAEQQPGLDEGAAAEDEVD